MDFKSINKIVHPDDEMMRTFQKHGHIDEKYFVEGQKHANLFVDYIRKFRPHLLSNAKILDFGCGHGRITRFLPSLLSPSKFVVADVWESAINFCAKEFEAIPFFISRDSKISKFDSKFDIVLSFSVFSHLPPIDFEFYLSELRKSLNEDGLLLFTTKGDHDAKKFDAPLENGFYFGHFDWKKPNETEGRLPTEGYSTMIVTRSYVEKIFNKLGLRLLEHLNDSSKLIQELYVAEPIP